MDKLKELLGEELFNQVKEKLGDVKVMVDDGNFVPKARLDEVIEQRNEYKGMVTERDNQLKELKKQTKNSEEMTAKIEELQQNNEKTVTEYEEKLKNQSFNFAVERAIAKAEAKNVKAVKALIDSDKLKLDGESIIGLDEQLTALKESDPYLFGADLKGRKPHEDKTPPPDPKNPWSKEHFNLTEQGRLIREEPETAERLKAAAGK